MIDPLIRQVYDATVRAVQPYLADDKYRLTIKRDAILVGITVGLYWTAGDQRFSIYVTMGDVELTARVPIEEIITDWVLMHIAEPLAYWHRYGEMGDGRV